jgi:hypothetical protein
MTAVFCASNATEEDDLNVALLFLVKAEAVEANTRSNDSVLDDIIIFMFQVFPFCSSLRRMVCPSDKEKMMDASEIEDFYPLDLHPLHAC